MTQKLVSIYWVLEKKSTSPFWNDLLFYYKNNIITKGTDYLKSETNKLILAGILNIATTLILNFAFYIYLGDYDWIPWSGDEGLRYLWVYGGTSTLFIALSFFTFNIIYKFKEVSKITYFLNVPLPLYCFIGTFAPIYDGRLIRTHLGLIICPILYGIVILAFVSALLTHLSTTGFQKGILKITILIIIAYLTIQMIGLYLSFGLLL